MYRLLLSLGLVEFFVFMPLWAIESSRALEWWLGLFSCMRSPGTAKGENLLPLSVLTVAKSFSAD